MTGSSRLAAEIHAFFVYGTLQRGGCRERFWPCRAVAIEPATTLGELRELGPYPGLLIGQDTVGGELWSLRPEDVPAALFALDEVEGASGGDDEWYTRRAIECRTADGRQHRAWCYFFAKPAAIAAAPRIEPDADGICRWREAGTAANEPQTAGS